MLCKVCQEASKLDRSVLIKNVFVKGCTSLRFESIKIHEKSSNHLKASAILAVKSRPKHTPAFKIITFLNKETLEKLSMLFCMDMDSDVVEERQIDMLIRKYSLLIILNSDVKIVLTD